MIRPAVVTDVPLLHRLICELADYEKARHEVVATPEQLHDVLFGAHPTVFAHIAEAEDGEAAGFALWFLNFSTWRGTNGIYLEDLYVRPDYRGAGYGQALLTELARICVRRGYGRLDWAVLDWNEPAQGFYRALGAAAMDTWTTFRLTGAALTTLGATTGEDKSPN